LAVVMAALTFVRGGNVTELQEIVDERSNAGARLKNNLRYSAELDEHLATVREAVETIESKVINPGALATNQQFFYRLEQELGITLIDLRQSPVEESTTPTEYSAVPYIVSVRGTYLQIVSFLQRLEQGDRVIRFNSTNFSPGRGTASQGADPYDPLIILTLDLELLGRS
jgi:Tfp pilus assembly protein PilO